MTSSLTPPIGSIGATARADHGDGRYSDYLQGEADIQTSVQTLELGEVGDDVWHIRHLTGGMAESIERMVGEIDGVSGRLHWLLGAIAAQLARTGEEVPDAAAGEGLFDEYLLARVQILRGYPESDFDKLMGLYLGGVTGYTTCSGWN